MGLFGFFFYFLFNVLRYLVPFAEDIFSLAYPILATAKAVIQEDTDAASQWLTYWTVISGFVIFESFGEWLISWLPLYHECKLLFVCWLVLPRFAGAAKIYDGLVIPYFLEYEEQIDEKLSEASIEAKRHLSTFVIYLVSEGSRIAGEKTMGGISLFLRLTGYSSVLDEKDNVNEETVYAVAKVVGNVISDHIPENKEDTRNIKFPINQHLIHEKADVRKGNLEVKEAQDDLEDKNWDDRSAAKGIEPLDFNCKDVSPPPSSSFEEEDEHTQDKAEEKEPKHVAAESKCQDKSEDDDIFEFEDHNSMMFDNDDTLTLKDQSNIFDESMDHLSQEEAKDLLDDFLSVIEDGVYLNVSTTTPDSSPRLRIVTLSADRWRLLWSHLRQKGNAASSLHLATVSSIDSRPLCVSLVACLEPKVVSFEAQGEEVHQVLSEGLRLLVSDIRERSKSLLSPILNTFHKSLMRKVFWVLQGGKMNEEVVGVSLRNVTRRRKPVSPTKTRNTTL